MMVVVAVVVSISFIYITEAFIYYLCLTPASLCPLVDHIFTLCLAASLPPTYSQVSSEASTS